MSDVTSNISIGWDTREKITGGTTGSAKWVKHGEAKFTRVTKQSDATMPISVVSEYRHQLSGAGALTIDLTALEVIGAGGTVTKDCTGLKLQSITVVPEGTGVVTITPGAANPYNIANDASFKNLVAGGEAWSQCFLDRCPDVAAGAKEIDFAGDPDQYAVIKLELG